MERDDIIRMAREAHRELVTKDYPGHAGQLDPWTMRLLERFAALVAAEKDKQIAFLKDSHDAIRELAYKTGAAEEREACARVCEETTASWSQYVYNTGCTDCAAAIRARGEEPKRHPGYIIGDHWLQAAYTRICTGETEDEVMTDYGWQRARGEA